MAIQKTLDFEHDFSVDGATMVIDVPSGYSFGRGAIYGAAVSTSTDGFILSPSTAGVKDSYTRRRSFTNDTSSACGEDSTYGAGITASGASGLNGLFNIWNLGIAAPWMTDGYHMSVTPNALSHIRVDADPTAPDPVTQMIVYAHAATPTAGICKIRLYQRKTRVNYFSLSADSEAVVTGLTRKRSKMLTIASTNLTNSSVAGIGFQESTDGGSTWKTGWEWGWQHQGADGVSTGTSAVMNNNGATAQGIYSVVSAAPLAINTQFMTQDMNVGGAAISTLGGSADATYESDAVRVFPLSGTFTGDLFITETA